MLGQKQKAQRDRLPMLRHGHGDLLLSEMTFKPNLRGTGARKAFQPEGKARQGVC